MEDGGNCIVSRLVGTIRKLKGVQWEGGWESVEQAGSLKHRDSCMAQRGVENVCEGIFELFCRFSTHNYIVGKRFLCAGWWQIPNLLIYYGVKPFVQVWCFGLQ